MSCPSTNTAQCRCAREQPLGVTALRQTREKAGQLSPRSPAPLAVSNGSLTPEVRFFRTRVAAASPAPPLPLPPCLGRQTQYPLTSSFLPPSRLPQPYPGRAGVQVPHHGRHPEGQRGPGRRAPAPLSQGEATARFGSCAAETICSRSALRSL